SDLQYRAANKRAVFGEDLRHAQLDSDNPVNRHRLVSLSQRVSLPLDIGCALLIFTAIASNSVYFTACPNALISTSTPGGRSSFINASTVSGVGSRMSMSRLCVRISNCSRDFLSTCGERSTVHLFFAVGSGIGPASRAPVRFAVSTISVVD